MNVIKLEHVSKTFGRETDGVHAVRDVTIHIAPGEIFGIIGYSGAGKSTLVRCINLLERPTAGTVTVAPADKNRKQVYLSVDGGKAFSLRAGDKVRISRSRYETELVRLTDRSIYEVLRTKMTGGIGHEE